MKGAEEDIAGNYFKPVRVNRLIAQAQESQRVANSGKNTSYSSNSNLASSFNSGLNTVGLNNGYQNGGGLGGGGVGLSSSKWGSNGSSWNDGGLTNGGSYNSINNFSGGGGG